ncbi:hypothetical protein SteCoe_20807 [Stentor coeruleus]|uniref:Uncharacterized protein n=1 Tax=Stentor coeruleus TaxID=5963 RepID=A0A1R2BR44_9CILI|nr:hypothetical protein SteCoe_20807 [Stentor coeruleus]
MEKRTNNANLKAKLNKSNKTEDKSPKDSNLILPQIRENCSPQQSPRHLALPEDKKSQPKGKKPLKYSFFIQASPKTGVCKKIGTTFSELTKNFTSDKNTQQGTEKITQILVSFGKLGRILDDLNNSPLLKSEIDVLKGQYSNDEIDAKIRKFKDKFFYDKADEPKAEENYSGHGLVYSKSSGSIDDKVLVVNDYDKLMKKYHQLEEEYYSDTNTLKKKLEKRKAKLKNLKLDYDKSLGKNEILASKHESLQELIKDKDKIFKSRIDEFQVRIQEIEEAKRVNNIELVQATDYMQKVKSLMKEKELIIIELNSKVAFLSELNANYITEIQTVKSQLKRSQKELEIEKKNYGLIETDIKELNNYKSQKEYLEQSLDSLKQNLDYVNTNYKDLQKNYIILQTKSEEKETILKETIEKLKDQPSPSFNLIREPRKARRNSTCALHIFEDPSQEQEQKLKLIKKISILEDQISDYQRNLEKAYKDIEYHKKKIEEKNYEFEHVMKKTDIEINGKIEETRKLALKDFFRFLIEFKKNKQSSLDMIQCNMCKKCNIRTVLWPCGNSGCKRSLSLEEECLNCRIPSKLMELKVFDELIQNFQDNYLMVELNNILI